MSYYNGWTNYETWNVNLWIENDEGLYHEKQRMVDRGIPITANDVKTFYVEYMNATTPDLTGLQERGEHVDAINYDEIAEAWQAEQDEAA